MFIRNHWYIAAFADELGKSKTIARHFLGSPVLLFRDASGQAAALEDRCIHRGLPLAGGVCAGATVRCPYHGLEFDTRGQCVRIPGQEQIPDTMRLLTYSLVERDALLWIWMGDPDKADPALIEPYPFHTEPGWVWSRYQVEYQANWELLNDNLLDLSHIPVVHPHTLADGGKHPEETFERVGNSVRVLRDTPDVEPSAFYKLAFPFKGNIDHYWRIVFTPGQFRFSSGGVAAGSGHDAGTPNSGVHMRHLHGITPLTEGSTMYFFSLSRNFLIDDADVTHRMIKGSEAALLEDKDVIELQQIRLNQTPGRPLVSKRTDQGLHLGRRIVEELIDQERSA